MKQPIQPERYRSEFLSRLFFFSHLKKDERVRLVDAYLKSIKDEKHQLEDARPQINKIADPFQRECLLFGLRMKGDMVKNVEKTLNAIRKIKK